MRKYPTKEELEKYSDRVLKDLFVKETDTEIYHSVRVQPLPDSKDIRVFVRLNFGEGKIPKEYTKRITDQLPAITEEFATRLYQEIDMHLAGIHYLAWNNREVVTYTPDDYL